MSITITAASTAARVAKKRVAVRLIMTAVGRLSRTRRCETLNHDLARQLAAADGSASKRARARGASPFSESRSAGVSTDDAGAALRMTLKRAVQFVPCQPALER